MFFNWPAWPCMKANSVSLVQSLLKDIIPRFGIPQSINSDRGSHFTGQIMTELCKSLGIKQRLHCPYHPQSAGLVERHNGILKNKLAKLCAETGLKWTMLLPLALMSMRSTPIRKHKLTPHEIITGRPMTIPSSPVLCMEKVDLHAMDESMLSFCSALTTAVQSIHRRVKAVQAPPNDQVCHDIQPGDWVCIREFRRKNALKPRWSKPQHVLLTTNTAVKCEGRLTWIHASHCKKTPPPPCARDQRKTSTSCGPSSSSPTVP